MLSLLLLVWGSLAILNAGNANPAPPAANSFLSQHDGAADPPVTPTNSSNSEAAIARTQLSELSPSEGRSSVKYQRNLYGPSWSDVDGNGCDTRNDILKRDLIGTAFRDQKNCKVASGTLNDFYSGQSVSFVSGPETSRYVQIDHIVPLSWAWHHGADSWSNEQRELFANDPVNLIATTEEMNQTKSDSGPSQWLPGDESAYCGYAESYVSVLSKWQLTINDADRNALNEILLGCD